MLNDSPQLDRAFQALADPVRRGMLARLSRGPASVSSWPARCSISLPAVLQHLKALEQSGLVAIGEERPGANRAAGAQGALGRRMLDRRAARRMGSAAPTASKTIFKP